MNNNYTVMAPNSWQGQWMNRQQLFSRIANNNQVHYTTGAFFSWDRNTTAYQTANLSMQSIYDSNVQIITPSKLQIRFNKISFIDELVLRSFCRGLSKRVDNKVNKNVLYLFHPRFYDYVKYIPHDCLVYHAFDNFSKLSSYNSSMQRKEKLLLDESDIVFSSSRLIQEHLESLSDKNAVNFLPNGVDFDLFSGNEFAEPEDLAIIPGPRICYVGSINKKVDLSLLDFLSSNLNECSFVMVGPIGRLESDEQLLFNRMKEKHNIYFLGNKDLNELPAYMHHCDINTMIYKTDMSGWSASGYPLKLHEYMAVGQHIISSDIEAVREFKDVIKIPTNKNAWVAAINSYLQHKTYPELKKQRFDIAKQNTWDNRVNTIECLVNEYLSSGQ